ncbi:MAG: family 16 glycoside hydrolase [Bacteroidia bacterium]
MKPLSFFFSLLILAFTSCQEPAPKEEWISLFNGTDLSGWKVNENPGSFRVEDGVLIAEGPRAHLFYMGEDGNASFTNFELKLEIMTHLHANSGVYYHTRFQEEGWPSAGHEVQVNNTHIGGGDYRELKKTGSLYSVKNVYKAFAPDSVWFTMTIRFEGKHLLVKVNDIVTVDHLISVADSLESGTFALQGHDPGSKVFYRNIQVKKLPDGGPSGDSMPFSKAFEQMKSLQSKQFAFIDLHVVPTESFSANRAVQNTYREGVNVGILSQAGRPTTENLENLPVFTGLEANNPSTLKDISPEELEKYDYVISDMNIEASQASETNLKKFTDTYFAEIMKGLENPSVDIWATPTLLPEELKDSYSKIWTDARIRQALTLAKNNHKAIEIDNRLKIPNPEFISLAKEMGCLFTFSHIAFEPDRNESDYFLTVIDSCKLDYKDLFVPGW